MEQENYGKGSQITIIIYKLKQLFQLLNYAIIDVFYLTADLQGVTWQGADLTADLQVVTWYGTDLIIHLLENYLTTVTIPPI